ncbi:MAG TPA: cytochrome c [Chitinophagaceae bacterium]|jgi:mono/diheme cytochrome c family protein
MKKTSALFLRVTIIMILFSFTLASCSVRRTQPITQQEFVPANNRILNGQKVFMANCNKCHPGGEGGLGPSVNGNIAPQFVKRFQMRHGLGVMPSFKKDEISKSDLRDISKFLHAWKSYQTNNAMARE